MLIIMHDLYSSGKCAGTHEPLVFYVNLSA